ncbi:MAG TPA: hypothetical protein VH165_35120 [Kofleriaceae bacterium]|nr:hypothetical protein [Kofleriaceae bacterium]
MQRMSALRVQNEDFPEAATKHLNDAQALHAAQRADGACYLLGYVVECCLKSVRLHDHAWRSATHRHDAGALSIARNQMASRLFGHNLLALLSTTIGTEGARYLPDLPPDASIYQWKETRRYQPLDPNAETAATSWMSWARFVYDATIVQMQLDGVL